MYRMSFCGRSGWEMAWSAPRLNDAERMPPPERQTPRRCGSGAHSSVGSVARPASQQSGPGSGSSGRGGGSSPSPSGATKAKPSKMRRHRLRVRSSLELAASRPLSASSSPMAAGTARSRKGTSRRAASNGPMTLPPAPYDADTVMTRMDDPPFDDGTSPPHAAGGH